MRIDIVSLYRKDRFSVKQEIDSKNGGTTTHPPR